MQFTGYAVLNLIKLFKRFADLQAYEELLYGQDRLAEGNTVENCATSSEFLGRTGGDRAATTHTPQYKSTHTGVVPPSAKRVVEQSHLGLLDSYGYAPSQEQEEQLQKQYESHKGISEYFGTGTFSQQKRRRLRSAVATKQQGNHIRSAKNSLSSLINCPLHIFQGG